MRIATWNVNNVARRLGLILDWLAETRPDAVCLQELKQPDSRFPRDAFAEAGYGAVWKGQSRWNGVAVLARGTEPVPVRYALPGDPEDDQARYVEAAVRGILIGCLYAPNGNPQPGPKFDYKLAWTERLIAHAAALRAAAVPAILAGDYNIVPEPRDIYPTRSYEGNALLQPGPRGQYARLLEAGWTDALRAIHPDADVWTFWDYKRNRWERDAGMRIDHLLLAGGMEDQLRDAGVDREVRGREDASDHAPVWIELDAPGRTRHLPKSRP